MSVTSPCFTCMLYIRGECSTGGKFAFFAHGIAIAKFLPVTGECFNQTVKITPQDFSAVQEYTCWRGTFPVHGIAIAGKFGRENV